MAYDFYISKKAPTFVQLYGKRRVERGRLPRRYPTSGAKFTKQNNF